VNYYDDVVPRGMATLEVGDVIMHFGQPYIVTLVNSCRARIEPLQKKHIKSETLFGKKIEFDMPGRSLNISVHT